MYRGVVEEFKGMYDEVNECLVWEERGDARKEAFVSKVLPVEYTYGKAPYARTYAASAFPELITKITEVVEVLCDCKFELCFLNKYENERNALGWHADDSPEIDHERPIAVVSLGAEREIWFRPFTNHKDISKQLLQDGSLLIMPAGMQQTHHHRILKVGGRVGPRISLTYRGLKK